jgi:uncharacterized protein (DUF1330 family)
MDLTVQYAVKTMVNDVISDGAGARPMYLVAELQVRDAAQLGQYAEFVQPLMARYGGRILAVSAGPADVIEGGRPPSVRVIHRWDSRAGFDAFYRSEEYRPLKAMRQRACESEIAVFEDATSALRARGRSPHA